MRPVFGYLGAILLVVLASLLCAAVHPYLAPTNMVMIFLLAVVLAATRLGLKPAILTALLSVVAFDLFFVPPRFSLRVEDTEYLITFFALFVVGVVISTLVARLGRQVAQVQRQEARTSCLYHLTRDLAGALDDNAVVEALRRAVDATLHADLRVVLYRDGVAVPLPSGGQRPSDDTDQPTIAWVIRSGRHAGAGTAAFADADATYLPIKSGGATIGVMVAAAGQAALRENRQLLDAFAAQAAMAFERVQLARDAEETRVLREKSHLEQALLNSISHDLRTPLVTIAGALDTLLAEDCPLGPAKRRELTITALDEASRLNRFVSNLLDMTRLEAGALTLRPEPCEIDELIGCAIGAVESRLGGRRIDTSLAPGLPPVTIDLPLLTQALVNLLDNALRYSPPTFPLTVSAHCSHQTVFIEVQDRGPGIPAGEEERIFDRFYRVAVPEQSGGTGLGLCIAKGIVEAHQGNITAANSTAGGLRVTLSLPAATPETLEEEA